MSDEVKSKSNSFMEKVLKFMEEKLAPTLGKFAQNKIVKTITNGMMGVIGVLVIGSFFLLIYVFGSNYLPFLKPLGPAALNGYQLTLGIVGLFVAASISGAYAKEYELDLVQTMLIGVGAFLLLTSKVEDGKIAIGNLGSSAMFTAIICSLVSGAIMKFCKDKKIYIRMPAGVPPAIEATFAFLVSGTIVFTLMWIVKSVLNIDVITAVVAIFAPLFSAAENIWVYTFRWIVGEVLWIVGIHPESIIDAITGPATTQWIAENAEAALAGAPIPHIWTPGLDRITVIVSSCYSLLYLMFRSKLKEMKALATASLLPVLFTIAEPLLFGIPIVFNPYLSLPWVLSIGAAAFANWGLTAIGLVPKWIVLLPWMTPAPFQAFLGTGGDLRGLILVVVDFLIGLAIYYPFWKMYEKSLLEKEKEKASEA